MASDEGLPEELLAARGPATPEALGGCRPLPRSASRMIRLRLDRRLQGRIDPSDVLQDAYLDYARRFAEWAARPTLPFFLWLRLLTGQKLVNLHRRHLGARMRDAGQEVSLYRGALPQASSASLAAQLLGRLTTASQAAVRAETQCASRRRSTAWNRSTARS